MSDQEKLSHLQMKREDEEIRHKIQKLRWMGLDREADALVASIPNSLLPTQRLPTIYQDTD